MFIHPEFDPIAFRLFGWPVYWYGIMYLLSFGWFYFMGQRMLKWPAFFYLRHIVMEDLTVAGLLGVMLGGRLGYVLFYNPSFYFANPVQIFHIWDGGMSFHGGLLGVILAVAAYSYLSGRSFLRLIDFAAVLTPIGLGLGRLGNFINGELPGRMAPESLPWAMVFPQVDDALRHPSPIYQALLEGLLLAAVMLLLARRPRPRGFLSGIFLICYALVRLLSEQFREPDAHIGLLWGNMSLGQWLSIPMFLAGVLLLLYNPLKQMRRNKNINKNDSLPADTSEDRPSADDSQPLTDELPEPDSAVMATVADSPSRGSWWRNLFANKNADNDDSPLTDAPDNRQTEDDRDSSADDLLEPSTVAVAAASHSSPSRGSWWRNLFADNSKEDEEDDAREARISRRYKRRMRKKQRR